MIVTVSQMEAITEAANARRDMRVAHARWNAAVDVAVAAGASNVAIAKACDVSETAIRKHRTRFGNGSKVGSTNGAAERDVGVPSAAPNPPLSPDETEG